MQESANNIGVTCAAHAPQPIARWACEKPEFFIGKFVKKGFQTGRSDYLLEHMWVEVKGVENGKLFGNLTNDPVICTVLKDGDAVLVTLDEIESVMTSEGRFL
jgi:uncharacterized protein YegJ (DUF2314 family)